MFAWNEKSWGHSEAQTAPMLNEDTAGMVAGTKVATQIGWRSVEAISEGDLVLTFDGGLQTVIAVTRHYVAADMSNPAHWPLNVPAGVLGNRAPMQILPNQAIMIESDAAEECFGDPFALIPATALEGYRGISQSRPSEWVEVVELHFAQDEIVFGNIGALFLCRAKRDLLSDMGGADYDVLSMDQADTLVGFLELETETRAMPNSEFRAAA